MSKYPCKAFGTAYCQRRNREKYQSLNTNNINKQTEDNKLDEKTIDIADEYKFGWSSYSEITNGRFAMIGFLAIILIELFSQQSFLKWAGIF